jgi:acyl-coenzyme A thioesterase PaaI-like protein
MNPISRLMQKIGTAKNFKRLLNIYAPLRGAGIRLEEVSDDFKRVVVSLDLRWFNVNYVGVHFGGSLYSMTDPFFMLMIMKNLGSNYIVWDKSACIDFIKPGRGKVTATFEINQELIDQLRKQASEGKAILPKFEVTVKDVDGGAVARVTKTLYIKRKPEK